MLLHSLCFINLITFLIYSFKCMSVKGDVHEDCNDDEDYLVSDYNIDDDGCLILSNRDEDELFCNERMKKKEIFYVYNPMEDNAIIKIKVTQRFKDATECKLVVSKWVMINEYNIRWRKSTSTHLEACCEDGCN